MTITVPIVYHCVLSCAEEEPRVLFPPSASHLITTIKMDLITAVGGEQALEMIVDLAVKEAVHLILSSKCCLWSRRKYNRCLKKLYDPTPHEKEERRHRLKEGLGKQRVLDYAVKVTLV